MNKKPVKFSGRSSRLKEELLSLSLDTTHVHLDEFIEPNINFLKNCVEIEEIKIYAQYQNYGKPYLDNFTIDISVITNFPKLKSLTITRCPVLDTTPLEKTTQLEDIFFAGVKIDNLNFLSEYNNLKSLMLYDSRVNNIDALANSKKLQYLTASESKITSIEPLRHLTELISLSLSDNNISDFTPIYGLTKMKDLELKGNISTLYHEIPYVAQLESKDFTVRNFTDKQLDYWKQIFKSWAVEGKFLDAVELITKKLVEITEKENEFIFAFEADDKDDELLNVSFSKNTIDNPKEIHQMIPDSVNLVSKITTEIFIYFQDYPDALKIDLKDIKENNKLLTFASIGTHGHDISWDTTTLKGNDDFAIVRQGQLEMEAVEANTLGQVIIAVLLMNVSNAVNIEGLCD